MKRLAIYAATVLLFMVGVVRAVSYTPESVNIGVTSLHSLPTVNYHMMSINLIGKQNDSAGLAWEYQNFRYWSFMGTFTIDSPSNYSGPSNYLVLQMFSNGTNAIDSYPKGQISYIIDGNPFTIALPAFQFTTGADFFSLYIASDGSTFYGRQDHLPTLWGGNVATLLNDSLTMSPSEAFKPEHLAAAIPEPASLALLGLGGFLCRRKKNQ